MKIDLKDVAGGAVQEKFAHSFEKVMENMQDVNTPYKDKRQIIITMPFMQLYRDFSNSKTEYSKEWNAFARQWQRPAAIRAHMEKGTDFRRLT